MYDPVRRDVKTEATSPTRPDELTLAAQHFHAAHGIFPIAGAETPGEGGQASGAAATAEPDAAAGAPGGENPPEPQQQQPAVDPALAARMDQVAAQVGALAQRLPQPPPGPDPVQQTVAQQLEQMGFPVPQQAADPQAQQQGQQAGQVLPPDEEAFLNGLVDDRARQIARDAVSPVLERMERESLQRNQERRTAQAEQLLEDYPELREANVRSEVATQVNEWAEDLGNPALAREPVFMELVLLAAKQAEAAAGETQPAGNQGGTTLEPGGGGAPPLAQVPEQQRAQRIADAGKRNSFFT